MTLDEATLGGATDSETRLEPVPIAANLRHDRLDERDHRGRADRAAARGLQPFPELAFGHSGSPGTSRGGANWCAASPRPSTGLTTASGSMAVKARRFAAASRCRSCTRQRGAPLDLIVAEAMILANSTWGAWLAELRRAGHLPQPGAAWRRA